MSQANCGNLEQPATVSDTMQGTVFTIGHSTHPLERFVSLLERHGVTALCDVRSTPYSRMHPQFNREVLKVSLRACGIKYVFLGKELGARSEDAGCYEGGRVQYDRLARTELFRLGLERIQRGIKGYRVSLVCAEKEPLECHRTILVARHLETKGIAVRHIHADGTVEEHANALSRLARMLNLREHERDLFRSREELMAEAYRLQEERIAYDASTIGPPHIRSQRSAAG